MAQISLNLLIPIVGGLVGIFIIITLILRWMLRSHIDLAEKRVQRLNEENLRREMDLKRKLDEAEKDYQGKVAAATREANRVKEEIQKSAMELKERIITEANREKEEIINDAKEEGERLKTTASMEIEEKVLKSSCEILRRVLTKELTEEMHHHLIDQVIKAITSEKGKMVAEAERAEVTLPLALTSDQRNRLTQVLADKTGRKIKLHEIIENHRLAGIYLKLGNLVIDGTMENRLNQVLTQAKERLKI